jgi:NAD/NADP transhydrogenase alpha subunit
MAINLLVLKEETAETRVSASPETVKKLAALGIAVTSRRH